MTVMAEYARRPRRAWQADGLLDIAIGTALLCIALIFLNGIHMVQLTQQTTNVASSEYLRANQLYIAVTTILQLAVAVPFFLIEPLKRRFVHPRSGYMRLRLPRHSGVATASVTTLLALSLMFAWTIASGAGPAHFSFWTANRVVGCVGMALALGLTVNHVKFGFARHLIVAAVSLAVTAGLTATSLNWEWKLFLLALSVGVSLLIVGTVSFLQLLRTPPIAEAAE